MIGSTKRPKKVNLKPVKEIIPERLKYLVSCPKCGNFHKGSRCAGIDGARG